ncbi:hypothetical protein BGW42_007524 [Actinomortierella wolfii]|nr:hypothetical protein BGW42_007524 [Actinomortierella wolfii]
MTTTASTAVGTHTPTSSISTLPPAISTRSCTPAPSTPPSTLLMGSHVIYRGLTRRSMEYLSLTQSNRSNSAHTLKGEILISSASQPGYIQYTIVLDQHWMTRRVTISSKMGRQERQLVLEVDKDQRWYKVTEHRLARSRSFYRSGISDQDKAELAKMLPSKDGSDINNSSSQLATSPPERRHCNMVDAEASLSDSSNCCYSSSSDSECGIVFEKINLSSPPKHSKRGSKRFSHATPLNFDAVRSVATGATAGTPPAPPGTKSRSNSGCETISEETAHGRSVAPSQRSPPSSLSHRRQGSIVSFSPSTSPSSRQAPSPSGSSPVSAIPGKSAAQHRSRPSMSLIGPKSYEHLPELDGCVNLDLGWGVSPSTFMLPVCQATVAMFGTEVEYQHLPGDETGPRPYCTASPASTMSPPASPDADSSSVSASATNHFTSPRQPFARHFPQTPSSTIPRASTPPPDIPKEERVAATWRQTEVASFKLVQVDFPSLELSAIEKHVAYVGPSRRPNYSLIECWQGDIDDDECPSSLVEVDQDGLVVRCGREWARIPCS